MRVFFFFFLNDPIPELYDGILASVEKNQATGTKDWINSHCNNVTAATGDWFLRP